MLKKFYLTLSFLALTITTSFAASLDGTIYTDDIGRMHFMGKGNYSGVRTMQNQEMQAGVINDAVDKYSNVKKDIDNDVVETVDKTEADITKVIKEKPVVPAASHKSSFSYEKGKMDPSLHYGTGGTYLPSSGVNESKTIYTDDLGRLHFFGRANQIKE